MKTIVTLKPGLFCFNKDLKNKVYDLLPLHISLIVKKCNDLALVAFVKAIKITNFKVRSLSEINFCRRQYSQKYKHF